MMVTQIHPTELKAKLDAGESIYLVDVRNPDEHAYCHLPDSVLVPLPEIMHRLDDIEPPAGAQVVVYCHHGVRSLSGAAILQAHGITNVASLAGGIDAWSQLIDPTVKRY